MKINKSKCKLNPQSRPQNGHNIYYETHLSKNNECILKKFRSYNVPSFNNFDKDNKFIAYAVKKNIIVGYLLGIMKDRHHMYISSVGVHKDFRGNKICSQIFERFIKHIEFNYQSIFVYSLIDATKVLKDGTSIGDLCYNRTISKLGYIRDLSFGLYKIFVKPEMIESKNYKLVKNSIWNLKSN